MHEQKSVNGSSEIELLETELADELAAVRDALNGTRLCEYQSEGRKSCEDACDEFDNLTDTLDRTFQRVKEMLLKVSS